MLPQLKQAIILNPSSTTNAGTAAGTVDTKGYTWMTIDVIATTSNDTTNNPSVLKLADCDTSNGTFTDITAFVGDGTGGFTIPAAVTEGDWGVKFNVNVLGYERYLKLSVSPLTTQTFTAIANLGRGGESPTTTTEANVKALVEA